MMSYFSIGRSDVEIIWQLYAEYHADYTDVVGDSGSKPQVVISQPYVDSDMLTFCLQIN